MSRIVEHTVALDDEARRRLLNGHNTIEGETCWCKPQERCIECANLAPCIHGPDRPTVVVHRQDS